MVELTEHDIHTAAIIIHKNPDQSTIALAGEISGHVESDNITDLIEAVNKGRKRLEDHDHELPSPPSEETKNPEPDPVSDTHNNPQTISLS